MEKAKREQSMNSCDPWEPFRDVMQDPWAYARIWKERTGGKVIGHLLPDVPEEIIHAAGGLPMAVQGAGGRITHAQAHIPDYTCSHAMGAMELGLRGEMKILDAMIIPYVCDTTRNLFHIWNHCFPEFANDFFRLPKRLGEPRARKYLQSELCRLVHFVASVTGNPVGPERLWQSIALYNKSRARLRNAYRLGIENPKVWTAERVQLLIGSAMRSCREEHLRWMDALPWDLESSPLVGDSIPLYVRGKVWDPPEITVILQDLGFTVVRDEIVSGYRSIEVDVSPESNDPIAGLVERHERTIPYTAYHMNPLDITTQFVRRVRESGARAVLFLNPKFCDAAWFDTPDLSAALDEEGIPKLVLETSARGESTQQIRLRLEAFREVLVGDLM